MTFFDETKKLNIILSRLRGSIAIGDSHNKLDYQIVRDS